MSKLKMKEIGLVLCVSAMVTSGYGVDQPGRIYADPIGSTQVDNSHVMDNVALIINNTEDRVGARAKMCQSFSDSPCERIMFNFPQLSLDKEKNLILLGDKPIAKLQRHGMRVTVNKDYRLGYEITSNTTDTGFDKTKG